MLKNASLTAGNKRASRPSITGVSSTGSVLSVLCAMPTTPEKGSATPASPAGTYAALSTGDSNGRVERIKSEGNSLPGAPAQPPAGNPMIASSSALRRLIRGNTMSSPSAGNGGPISECDNIGALTQLMEVDWRSGGGVRHIPGSIAADPFSKDYRVSELARLGSIRGARRHLGPALFFHQTRGARDGTRGGGVRPGGAGDGDPVSDRVAARRSAFARTAQGGDLRIRAGRICNSFFGDLDRRALDQLLGDGNPHCHGAALHCADPALLRRA